MSAPPGCPMRRVDEINPVKGGANLRLSCGHWLFVGGWTDEQHENVVRFNVQRACQVAPCYVEQRPMGKDC